jgi:hypothetical protein
MLQAWGKTPLEFGALDINEQDYMISHWIEKINRTNKIIEK